jgi:hypothetical protein
MMLRARRHFLEGVGGVVHDNERPRLCLAVVIVDKIEGVASAFMFGVGARWRLRLSSAKRAGPQRSFGYAPSGL